MKKMRKIIIMFIVLISLVIGDVNDASANMKVMWGKTELKIGQIGKVTIISNTSLWKLEKDNSLTKIRELKKGEEYRVYSYKSIHEGLYGVGDGAFIKKDDTIKYETPSKEKLRLINSTKPGLIVTPIDPKPGDINPVEPPSSMEVISVQ